MSNVAILSAQQPMYTPPVSQAGETDLAGQQQQMTQDMQQMMEMLLPMIEQMIQQMLQQMMQQQSPSSNEGQGGGPAGVSGGGGGGGSPAGTAGGAGAGGGAPSVGTVMESAGQMLQSLGELEQMLEQGPPGAAGQQPPAAGGPSAGPGPSNPPAGNPPPGNSGPGNSGPGGTPSSSSPQGTHGGGGAGAAGFSPTAVNGPISQQQTAQNASQLVNMFQQQYGLTHNQAVGVVASMMGETPLNPSEEQGGSYTANPSMSGDVVNQTGYGIAQWGEDRKQGLLNYAAQHNLPPSSMAAQVGFMQQELNGPFANVIQQIKAGGDSATNAAEVWTTQYEKASDPNMSGRLANIQQVQGMIA